MDNIDFAALDTFLTSDKSPDDCMMLSDLDGCLHGIACAPVPVPPDEWLELALGADVNDLPGWVVASAGQRLTQIMMKLTRDTPVAEPIFWQSPEGHVIAMDWCEGFMQAVALRPKEWLRLTESGIGGHMILPIMTHMIDEAGNSVLGIAQEDLDDAIDKAAARIPEAVVEIFLFWQEEKERRP